MKINLRDIDSIAQLHALFQQQLGFPDFYGQNWDAFWDSITGLVEMPNELTLTSWKFFATRFPHDARILSEIIEEFNTQPDITARIYRTP